MQKMMGKYPVDSPLKSLTDMLQTVHVGEVFANFLLTQLREHYNKERIEKVPNMTVSFKIIRRKVTVHFFSVTST